MANTEKWFGKVTIYFEEINKNSIRRYWLVNKEKGWMLQFA